MCVTLHSLAVFFALPAGSMDVLVGLPYLNSAFVLFMGPPNSSAADVCRCLLLCTLVRKRRGSCSLLNLLWT
jgi:hypothetical protein